MNDLAIRVVDLSKLYRIGKRRAGYKTLRDSLTRLAAVPYHALRSAWRRSEGENGNGVSTIWALKDISFEVKRGDVVGIVGRNGAGKSTLLKVLSRITEPTTGYAEICGRVGSLLEVGTGFHPELTGRENIYLNGAILGMGRAEIQRKFDEIVDFAAVEKFIDTPVKHFSSGMYLRLAFAVAAHLEPDILVVDEVLAVGDAAFQKKCLGRIQLVAREGRTVLFVSHNMGAIRSLCHSGIYLDDGKVELIGNVSDCIARYFQDIGALPGAEAENGSTNGCGKGVGFGRVSLKGPKGTTIDQAQGFEASTVLRLGDGTSGFYLFCILEDMDSRTIFHLQEASPDLGVKEVTAGDYHIRIRIPPLWLVPGMYSLHFKAMLWGSSGSRYVSDKYPLDIEGVNSSSTATHCTLHPRADWSVRGQAAVLSAGS